ncbi:MAG TPA: glutamate--tRNA ligase [Candidatus Sulfotelmatobacter sp.]|nr:glutamate--tRNA ligase [Candidatus Sulfotelmatobacter sp.]
MPDPKPVRVRFAPSPTGWLHVGGARTAYFNWLFARQRRGRFLIRIEDTDVARNDPAAERGVLDDLKWLGLEWDEGPDVGGSHGPYRQSERLPRYREEAELLVSRGLAYPCFCTEAELESRRKAALAAGRPPHYDGQCRRMSGAERDAARGEGRAESIRYAVEPRDWVLHDAVRGEVRFPAGMVGDFVLLRSNGLPTYNFACVIDDSAMEISHVIRAEEHLPNTARQLMLYAALDRDPPAFAHLALILNRDRTKMSKRDGEAAVAVGDWRRAGYVPEAMLSYLALLGFHTPDEREILSREELLKEFTLDRVGKSGAIFDPDKLRWMNAHYLHHAGGAQLRAWAADFLPASVRTLPDRQQERLLELVRGNVATLAELSQELEPYLAEQVTLEPDAAAAIATEPARRLLTALAGDLGGLADWSGEVFKSALQSAGARLGLRGRDLFQPARAALTGRTHGPELPHVAEALGRDRCVSRLRAAAAGSVIHG